MYRSKRLDHLGLVSGMIDELDLVNNLNNLLETDGIERQLSLGLVIKALILNGLGFAQRTLYMVSSFYSDKPIELLLGEGVEAGQLNDTVLGRCLDAIYAFGCTELYANLAPDICTKKEGYEYVALTSTQSFNGIHVLYGKEKTVILNLKNINAKIIGLLGDNYRKYYFLI